MALSRRTGTRFQASIWPGFVDAMTGLLLVLMFVLTIFMVVQFVLRETITGQESELNALSAEVAALATALGLEQDRSASLTERVGALTSTLGDARALQEEQGARIASFEEQVASLLAARDTALGTVAELEGQRDQLLSDAEALELALAGLRDEVDAQAEAARLAAARREALDALIADLRRRNAEEQGETAALRSELAEVETQLSEEEQARLAEAAAAAALRERLQNADMELTAMTLALEQERQKAEDTLTLLAAAQAAGEDLNQQLAAALLAGQETGAEAAALEEQVAALMASAENEALGAQEVRAELTAALAAKLAAENKASEQLTRAEERAALLAEARAQLAEQEGITDEAQRQQALLNQQVAALRQQLSGLQALLDDAKVREAATEVQLQSLGNELNTALARVAAEERRRAQVEEERRKLLELEKENLERYRSEFFGRLRDVIGAQEGVQIVGDRFVFSSEVLFAPGEARLSPQGQSEISKIAGILNNVAGEIPDEIDWVLQVDGHTDDVPLIQGAQFADNWELSQARALSVVRYMVNVLGVPPDRLSANGFGQYQPINTDDTPEAHAQNRRIELKFTEK